MTKNYLGDKSFKKILLFSGGVDSVIAYAMLQPDHCFYFDLGVKYNKAELSAVSKMGITKLSIVDTLKLGDYEEDNANIPMRNLYLLMGATNEAIRWWGNDKGFYIYLTVQKDEMSAPDRNTQFFDGAQLFLSKLTNKKIITSLPFQYTDKSEMVRWFLERFPDGKDKLLHSYSCFRGHEKECGDCPACFRKWVAFVNNDIMNDVWEESPQNSATAKIYKSNMDKYSGIRQKRMRTAFNKAGVEV